MMSQAMPGLVLRSRSRQMAVNTDQIVLIDCPPSLSLLTVMHWSHRQPVLSRWSQVASIPGWLRGPRGTDPRFEDGECWPRHSRFLINRYDGRKKVAPGHERCDPTTFGEKVFATTVTPSVKIEETSTIKKTIFSTIARARAPATLWSSAGKY